MGKTRRSYASQPAGAAKVPAGFELDGVTFEAAVSFLDLLPLAQWANWEPNPNNPADIPPEMLSALTGVYEDALGESYQRFREHVRKHHTEPAVLLQIMMDMLEDATEGLDFPQTPSSPSHPGDGSTAPTHTVVSSSGAIEVQALSPEREAQLRAAVDKAQQDLDQARMYDPGR